MSLLIRSLTDGFNPRPRAGGDKGSSDLGRLDRALQHLPDPNPSSKAPHLQHFFPPESTKGTVIFQGKIYPVPTLDTFFCRKEGNDHIFTFPKTIMI